MGFSLERGSTTCVCAYLVLSSLIGFFIFATPEKLPLLPSLTCAYRFFYLGQTLLRLVDFSVVFGTGLVVLQIKSSSPLANAGLVMIRWH